MIEEELVKKISREQARLLQNSTTVSFSQVLSEYLYEGLKNGKK